ncbi:MAG: hypothetical protein ABFD80_06940 [Acidobacteriota bacterium]
MIAERTRVRLADGEMGLIHRVVTKDKKTGELLEKPLLIIILDQRRSNGDKIITAFEDEVEVAAAPDPIRLAIEKLGRAYADAYASALVAAAIVDGMSFMLREHKTKAGLN